jgi:hypothetical protein
MLAGIPSRAIRSFNRIERRRLRADADRMQEIRPTGRSPDD